MANTYVAIATVTVGSGGAANIEFTSIPATYTDLLIKVSARSSSSDPDLSWLRISLNGSTSNFTYIKLYGNGSTTATDTGQDISPIAPTVTSNTFGNAELYIPNYAGSTNKSISVDGVGEANQTKSYANLQAILWSNTAAITSITLSGAYNNLAQYSSATLYGIKKD